MTGFNHFIINGAAPGKKMGSKIPGIRETKSIASIHLFETKKGRFVRIPRSPIRKKKSAKIPNQIGDRIENIVI